MPLCIDLLDIQRWNKRSRISRCLKTLGTYGAAAKPLTAAFSNMRTRNVSLGQTGGIPTEAYAASLGADYAEVSEIFWRNDYYS